MNLRVKFSPFLKGFFSSMLVMSCFWLVVSIIFFPYLYEERKANEESYSADEPEQNNYESLNRENTYEELSPDGHKKVIRYKLNYQPELFSQNYTTYLHNKIILAVVETIGDVEQEHFLFIGEERTGDPHWLGNNYLFFETYCGTSCQGLMLLDTQNRQIRQGALGYYFREGERMETRFGGWFDQDFDFYGSINQIHADMINNKPYLIFDISNEQGVESGQKRFLFTGRKLILEP